MMQPTTGLTGISEPFRGLIVVSHPDDEILWCGGWLLKHIQNDITIIVLCRASDPDRAPRFRSVCAELGLQGIILDMDDSPEQPQLPMSDLKMVLTQVIDHQKYDICLTHSPVGEYTRHRRHEETSLAMLEMFRTGAVNLGELWLFAYEDGNGDYLPKAIPNADICIQLEPDIWRNKYRLITETYGFSANSWEAQVTPSQEAFWRISPLNSTLIEKWISMSPLKVT